MEENKELEKFSDNLFKEIGLEEPSSLFVDRVMNTVEASIKEKQVVYSPLISKKVWSLIAVCFAALVVWVLMKPVENSLFGSLELNISFENIIPTLKSFPFFDTLIYGMLAFAVMLLLQILVLKTKYDKQIQALN